MTSAAGDFRHNNFDLIRLLAALQVALVHIINQLHIEGGFVHIAAGILGQFPGVPIFFLVSGLLVSRSFEQSTGLGEYLRNRALRIYPALWVCLLVTLATILAFGFARLGTATTLDWLRWWAAQMSVFQADRPGFFAGFGTGAVNASLWTIPIELSFYLLLPALYWLLGLRRRRGTLALTALMVPSFGLHFAYFNWSSFTDAPGPPLWLGANIPPHLWMFLAGVLIQRNFERVRPWVTNRVGAWLIAFGALAIAARAAHFGVGGVNMNPLSFVALAGLVMACALSFPSLSQRLLRDNDISYGFYIYHLPVINVLITLGLTRTVTAAILALILSLMLATASWFFIERPFLRRKRGALHARVEHHDHGLTSIALR